MRKQITSIFTIAVVATVLVGLTVGTVNAQDTVHSFNMDAGAVSGDVPAGDNVNGLQITGQVGAWPTISTGLTGGKSSATDDGVTLEFDLNGAGAGWGGTVGNRGAVGA